MSGEPLWDHFVVVGLASGKPLQTLQGDSGFLGKNQKYKPDFVDCLPQSHDSAQRAKPPPQLPTCCLPAGVDIVLHADLPTANVAPHTYAVVLTEGDGTKVYASCLSFYDKVPHSLCAKHEDLLGAVALKAICLLSHQPYLSSTDKVLRELYHIAFVYGSTVPLPDIISSLLSVPSPQLGGPKVCLKLGRCQRLLCPPLAVGPLPGELPLQPLLEVLHPDNLVGLFAAVLLEQRVLLRSQHHWLLTAAAEGVVRLLHPLKYQHVYIPVMPISLTDYLDAPTPFLMGLHSSEYVEARAQQQLVVVDLDADMLSPCTSDTLLQRCLSHPYMQQLRSRVRMLMQPCVADADRVGQHSDPWVLAAQQLSTQPWGPCKQALLSRIFLEFFRNLLDSYQTFLVAGSTDGSRSTTYRALSGMQGLLSMRVSRAGPSSSAGLPAMPQVRSGALSSLLSPLQPQCRVDMIAVQHHHWSICGRSDPTLLQQFMQGLPFLSFVEAYHSTFDSQGWFSIAEKALHEWRTAEQQLLATPQSDIHLADTSTEVISISSQNYIPLMPPSGLVYPSFPALILVELGHGPGSKLRRSSNNSKKRQSPGRRRAISELMGSEVDLRRRSPVQATLKTEAAKERQIRANDENTMLSPTSSGIIVSATLRSHGAANIGHSATSSSSGCTCTTAHGLELGEYSAEADIVRRQTGLLVQLMHGSSGDAGGDALSKDDLEAARLLLCLQTGGNGWFLVSRLKEIITASATTTAANSTSSDTGTSSSGFAKSGTQGAASRKGASGSARQGLTVSFSGGAETSPARQLATPCSLATSSVPVDLTKSQQACQPQAAAAAGSKHGGSSRSMTSSIAGHKPPSQSKSNKLFGASKASSNPRAAIPPGLKASHSMESFANAAQAMASAFSVSVLNCSASSKGKTSRAGSPDVSPAHQRETTSERATREDISVHSSLFSSRHLSVIGSPISNIDECSSSKTAAIAQEQAIVSHVAAATASTAAAGSEAAYYNRVSVDKSLQGSSSGACTAISASSTNGTCSTGVRQCGVCERLVSTAVFGVLADMMNSIIEVAAVQDDFRVALAALELSCIIACQPVDGPRNYLLSSLATNPTLYTEWFWAGAFGFAVSNSYLQAQEFTSIRDVVLLTLAQFARYITGLGISGTTAWLLLAQLATDHLGAASAAQLQSEDMLHLRAHLAHLHSLAWHGRSGASGPIPPVIVGSNSSALAAGSAQLIAKQLPEHVQIALKVCGLSIGPENGNQVESCKVSAGNIASNTSDAAAVHRNPAGGSWRLSQMTGAACSKLAAMEWDDQCGFSAAPEVDRGCTDCNQAALGCVVKQARFNMPSSSACATANAGGFTTAVVPCACARLLPAPAGLQQQPEQQQQHCAAPTTPKTRSPAAASAPAASASPMQTCSPTLSGTTDTATAAATFNKLAYSPPVAAGVTAAAAASEQRSPESSSFCTTPRSGQGPSSPDSPKSPRNTAGYKPLLSPRGLSCLSARAAQQQGSNKGSSSSKSYSRRNSYALGVKAATAAVASAPESPRDAAAAAGGIQLERDGKSLLEPGTLQHAVLHGKPVVALDASNYTVVSVGLDASLKVLDSSDGNIRLVATMTIPALDSSTNSSSNSTWHPGYAATPVLKLWPDGHRVAIGNATKHAVWIVDLQGSAASIELPGGTSAISAIHTLQRNHNALLLGFKGPGSSCYSRHSTSAVYLWDLRQTKKPAASLDTYPVLDATRWQPAAAATAAAAVNGATTNNSMPSSACYADADGVLNLTVHDDGVLAAAGFNDGRALVWDMRHPSQPLCTCCGHQGPVTQAQFLPANAAAAQCISEVESVNTPEQSEPAQNSSSVLPMLLTASDDWTARIWDVTTGSCRATCVGHGGPVTAIHVATSRPMGNCTGGGLLTKLVTGAADGSVAVWGLQGELCTLVQQHQAAVQLIAQGDSTLVTGAADRTCRVWGLPDAFSCTAYQPPNCLSFLELHAAVCSTAYDPVAELFSAGHRDGVVSLWNCSSQ